MKHTHLMVLQRDLQFHTIAVQSRGKRSHFLVIVNLLTSCLKKPNFLISPWWAYLGKKFCKWKSIIYTNDYASLFWKKNWFGKIWQMVMEILTARKIPEEEQNEGVQYISKVLILRLIQLPTMTPSMYASHVKSNKCQVSSLKCIIEQVSGGIKLDQQTLLGIGCKNLRHAPNSIIHLDGLHQSTENCSNRLKQFMGPQ